MMTAVGGWVGTCDNFCAAATPPGHIACKLPDQLLLHSPYTAGLGVTLLVVASPRASFASASSSMQMWWGCVPRGAFSRWLMSMLRQPTHDTLFGRAVGNGT